MNERETQAKHARLPVSLMGPVIATIEFGDVRYAVPWAMWPDRDGLLWLYPDFETTPAPCGTSSMRLELRGDGYHVWPVRGYTYRPQHPGFAGEPSQPYIPVAVLEGTGWEKIADAGRTADHPDWWAKWAPFSRDQDGNLTLRYIPTGGIYRLLPAEDL